MDKLIAETTNILNKNCFSPQAFSSMREICAEPANRMQLSDFEYARVYDNGTACILYSNQNIANYVISNEIHITAHVPDQIIDTEFWFIPPPNGPYNKHFQEISTMSKSKSFVNFIRRHFGYY